jgi:hypothetical protein
LQDWQLLPPPLLLLTQFTCCCCYRLHDEGMRDTCPPIPGVDHTLIVYPVPNQLLKRPWPYMIIMKPPLQDAVTISPGQYGRAWPYTT